MSPVAPSAQITLSQLRAGAAGGGVSRSNKIMRPSYLAAGVGTVAVDILRFHEAPKLTGVPGFLHDT